MILFNFYNKNYAINKCFLLIDGFNFIYKLNIKFYSFNMNKDLDEELL